MSSRSIFCCVLPLCLPVLLAGCGSSDEPAAEIDLAPVATVSSTTEVSAEEEDPAAASTDSNSADGAATRTAKIQAFDPPFPDRFDLFEPPQRAQGRSRRDDEYGETVELKGFINAGEPRVILAIGEEISPLSEGAEKYGVKVISIQEPSVVLQRGRTRWTATLE